jgi:diketogulonate reductase-like aldo/keto reductase
MYAGTSYIDLMLVHWPAAARIAGSSPMNSELRLQTWRVLECEVSVGRARSIGVSNFEIHHLQHLLSHATIPPSVNQIEVHPQYQQVQPWACAVVLNPGCILNLLKLLRQKLDSIPQSV